MFPISFQHAVISILSRDAQNSTNNIFTLFAAQQTQNFHIIVILRTYVYISILITLIN